MGGWCRIIARLRPLARGEQAQGMQQHVEAADERTLVLPGTGDQKHQILTCNRVIAPSEVSLPR